MRPDVRAATSAAWAPATSTSTSTCSAGSATRAPATTSRTPHLDGRKADAIKLRPHRVDRGRRPDRPGGQDRRGPRAVAVDVPHHACSCRARRSCSSRSPRSSADPPSQHPDPPARDSTAGLDRGRADDAEHAEACASRCWPCCCWPPCPASSSACRASTTRPRSAPTSACSSCWRRWRRRRPRLVMTAIHLLWRDRQLQSSGFAKRGAGFIAGYGLIGLACCFGACSPSPVVVNLAPSAAFGGDLEALAEERRQRQAHRGVVDHRLRSSPSTAGLTEEVVFRAYAITPARAAGLEAGRATWCPASALHPAAPVPGRPRPGGHRRR